MLSNYLFLISLAVLIAVVLVVLGAVIYFSLKRSEAKPGADPKLVKLRFDSLRNSFKQAVELIENNIVGRSQRYSIPWVLLLNEGAEVRQLPIEQSGVASALSTESASSASTQGISWHFFDKGIVVDMQGSYLGSPDEEDAAEKPWDEFLGLCRNYRPQRPFDSVVITVPATLLQDTSADANLELSKLARIAHRRLWLAQNRFAMRFAVYVVISDCDRIEGFSPFARALPDSMRAGMLGWSSPYDLSTTYQSEWVEEAVSSMVRTLSDTSAELFAMDLESADTARFFLLPSRVQALGGQLKIYVDELMRPSAYHEPFFFRGIYLTGDSSQAAQAAVAVAEDGGGIDTGQAPELDLVSQLVKEPAFLRDLFEKKIFLEYGVARPSRQQLTRPATSLIARWGAGIVLGVWAVGLLVATYQLQRRNPELVRTLAQIEQDTSYRMRALERNEAIPITWYRAKTLTLLEEIEKLGSDRAWTFFMPGSWDIFENLNQRVAQRIEREFAEIAINTLRKELYTRAAELTGVSQDDSTSELIIGGDCKLPVGYAAIANAPPKLSLVVEELPEFTALTQYVGSVERLEQAMLAMARLQKPGLSANDDLRVLVKYTLGAEIPDNLSQSLRFFQGDEAFGRQSPATINVSHIRQAVRCSLEQGLFALDRRIYQNNDLLVTERQLNTQMLGLFGQDGQSESFSQTLARVKQAIATFREQESLLGVGKGSWMRQAPRNMGKFYDSLMNRIATSTRLLGPELVEKAQQHADLEFSKMRSEFETRFGVEGQSGVVWSDKETRFAFAPERLALREALINLLAQPFMVAPSDRDIPSSTSESVLVWDNAGLDQALKLADQHKSYVSEQLTKFPAAYRAEVAAFVNAQFTRLLNDHLLDALTLSGRADAGVMSEALAFEASLGRLAKLQDLFVQLGATRKAQSLQNLVSQDALQRLRQVDQRLQQQELYSVRGRDFRTWMGEAGPVLNAYGVTDAASLQQYLAVQFSRAETLGRQSEIYLASLDHAAADSQLARRWQAINKELERYRLKNPNGSLVMLEQFLVANGADTDRFNCVDKLSGRAPAARGADYFAEKYAQIYAALMQKCSELHNGERQEQWMVFSNSFNQMLAARHPFALLSTKDVADTDFEDLGMVLKNFEKIMRGGKSPAAGGQGVGGLRSNMGANAIARFTDQFDRIKAFLAPLYPQDEGAIAGYDLQVELRANQGGEIEGNKIIDWSVEVGSQTLKLRDPARPLRWEPGTPITITLRLAKDTLVYALADPMQSHMATDGKTVSFHYEDTWSLLRLIQRQRDADASLRNDGRTQLLRLEFPLSTVPDAVRLSAQDVRARVYLKLAVLPVGKRSPLVWPSVFPIRAPEFISP